MKVQRRHEWVVVLLALVVGGCAGNGCAGCNTQPLPAGGLPVDQTLEGGAQVRLTPQGFARLTQVAEAAMNDALSEGMCLPDGGIGIGIGDIQYCKQNDGSCTPGCQTDIHIDDVTFTPQPGRLRVRTQFDIHIDLPVQFDPIIGGAIGPCTLNVTSNNNIVDADIEVGIRSNDGELTVELADLSDLDINPSISGCSFVGPVIGAIADLVTGFIGTSFITDMLRPILSDLVAGMLPDPLGIEGVLSLGGLLGGVAGDEAGGLEARVVPGGYAHLEGGGLSLGVITGFNADQDPATRSPALDSEPARCVPPFAAPDFTTVPLGKSSRQTFQLGAADLFRGNPEPGGDLALGVSDTFLDLVGHHLVSSGTLCLGLGTEQIPQLTLGTVGLFIPSLAELGGPAGDDPLLLKTRPLRPVGFTIGLGTPESPSLTVHIQDFEIDFYAFLFERYTRAFTMQLDLDVGLNLEFTTDANGDPAILPILTGLESENVGVTVLNEEFLREDRQTLEDVLPSILDVAVQLIDDSLQPIALPEFAGFRLDDLTTQKIATSEDEFLAITADLGAGTLMATLGTNLPSISTEGPVRAPHAAPRLVVVDTPSPAVVREALGGRGGRLPGVTVELPTVDALGRALEWTHSLGGGLWSPFYRGGQVTIRERGLALQGRYALHLKARAVGDYRTLDEDAAVIPLVIDSVGPRILVDRIARDERGLSVTAVDLVSPADQVTIALGGPGAERPFTEWTAGRFPDNLVRRLAGADGGLTVFARDEVGNLTAIEVEVPGLTGLERDQSGGCGAGGRGGLFGLALVALAALVGLGRRHGRAAALLALVFAAGALPACSCNGDGEALVPEASCETADDCAGFCDDGQIGVCIEDSCVCQDELSMGSIGAYSEMAIGDGGKTIWVSAYNRTHGDLMVARVATTGRIPDEAWTFVDGVPDGPVVVQGSRVRGGIADPGEDVGLHTDIAVSAAAAMVSYHDRTSGSLKLASNAGGEWHHHVVEAGQPAVEGAGYALIGQYSTITLTADGRPAVFYFAELLTPEGEVSTELRYAEATVADPRGAADWTIEVVDRAIVPMSSSPDPLTIPDGTGLFAAAARLGDDRPVVVYYDRVTGDLETAYRERDTGLFGTYVLDGGDGADVGWYPGLAIDGDDKLHISYVDAGHADLLYWSSIDRVPEVIDDGYRVVGQTADGLPKPELHLIGDDSAIVVTPEGPIVAYQDATTHELLVARRQGDTWVREVLAGDEDPFVGGYGFFASAALGDSGVLVSTFVIDQPNDDSWVEVLGAAPAPIE